MLTTAARALWAKSNPRHELWRHLLDIAAVARALIPIFWNNPPIPERWLWFLVALHDIGKADALFQNKAPEAIAKIVEEMGFFDGLDTAKSKGFRHEARSAEWLEDYLKNRKWDSRARNPVISAIRGHHGDFDASAPTDELSEKWNPLRNLLAELMESVLQPDPTFAPQVFEDASAVGLMLTGLIVLSDWIASNEDFYDHLEKHQDAHLYFENASESARKFVDDLHFDSGAFLTQTGQPLTFKEVWQNVENLRPSQLSLQKSILAGLAPGLAIYEAPMGEGKTEGAVYLVEEWNRQCGTSGLYFALPTMATSNQMFARYSEYLEKRSPKFGKPRLTHGMAWLLGDELRNAPDEPNEDAPSADELERIRMWFAPSKRALLAPEGVGTVDQALMSALKVKHGFLRLFGLSRKVLVIDEVHAYDAYMQTILQRLLKWCKALKIPVVLLSATLSSQQKQGLIQAYSGVVPVLTDKPEPYPLLTFAPLVGKPFCIPVEHEYEQKTIKIVPEWGLLEDHELTAKKAAALVKNGGCLCVLVNTVSRAQKTFRALKKLRDEDGNLLFSAEELFLFHARFTARRRDEIEKSVLHFFGPNKDKTQANPARPKRAILVATQVVEQSLDVCFDVMLTDLAPIDLILQRAGRLYRHAVNPRYEHKEPVLYIALPPPETPLEFGRVELKRGKDKNWRGVYDRATLIKTLELLKAEEVKLPRDFRRLIQFVYDDAIAVADLALEVEIQTALIARTQRTEEYEAQANSNLIPIPDPMVFTYGQTTNAKDEAEEGQGKSYFRAQTRLGDDSRAVFVLTEQRLINAFKNACNATRENRQKRSEAFTKGSEPPKRYQPKFGFLKELFWQKANVPAWWLNAEAQDGYEKFIRNNQIEEENGDILRLRWLQSHTVIIAPDGEWHGTINNKPMTLRVDPTLGLLLENETESDTQEGAEGA